MCNCCNSNINSCSCQSQACCCQVCSCCCGCGCGSNRNRCRNLSITSPGENERVRCLATVEGTANACEWVFVTIDNNNPIRTRADCDGNFCVENPFALTAGAHTVHVRTSGGCTLLQIFHIRSANFCPPTSRPSRPWDRDECGRMENGCGCNGSWEFPPRPMPFYG